MSQIRELLAQDRAIAAAEGRKPYGIIWPVICVTLIFAAFAFLALAFEAASQRTPAADAQHSVAVEARGGEGMQP